ncbi:MAG: hypothetical protein HYV35_07475 [Lentisphaerae bacterium]|nr:hypothetical protein [Lentisphaerota bacterium]
MLSKILAIAGLTIRTAIRSRVFALLLALVVISCAGLPLIIKSDGTVAGQAQLFIHYAFGLAVALLSLAAAWSAAGAVSLEVSGRQMHVLRTKPVHAFEVWLGKWLGLLTINLVMLALAGGLIYALLRWTTHSAVLPANDQQRLREEILRAHRVVAPDQPRIARDKPLAQVERGLLAVPPEGTQSWTFRLPEGSRPALFLQFRFATSRIERQMPVAGEWLITADETSGPYSVSGSYTPHVNHTLKLPPGKPGQKLTVTYKNVETTAPATVVFAADPGSGLSLLIHETSFESNFLRALLLVLARLAFFSALGLTAGMLFSFPVAVFTALGFLLMTALRGGVGAKALAIEEESAHSLLTEALNTVLNGIWQLANLIAPPLARFDPLNFLPTGGFIPWTLVGQAWAVLVLAYGGALALLGIWRFSRREMYLAAG